MNKVAIVDYGLCNVDSVGRGVEECGAEAIITDDPDDLARADKIILPGVGAFPEAMANLRARSLDQALRDEVLGAGAPFLGICLGLHLLAATGQEFGDCAGLGFVDGVVRRLVPGKGERVPHMGWNQVHTTGSSPLFEGIPDGTDFYFVHSYHIDCQDQSDVVATTPFCGGFASAVQKGSVFGVQFHPEKSQRHGLALLSNFLSL